MTDENKIMYPTVGNVIKNPSRKPNFLKESYDGYRPSLPEKDTKTHHYGLIIAIVLTLIMQLL